MTPDTHYMSKLILKGIVVRRGDRDLLSLAYWEFPLKGGICALIGPNGAGKSTLLKVLHGLIVPTQGSIRWGDADVLRRAILLQSPVLLRRSVRANLDFILKRRGLNRQESEMQMSRLLTQAGLQGAQHKPARILSGGQQRRLALAQALAQDPQVMLLDEPTAGLDPNAAEELVTMMQQASQRGITIILSSHEYAHISRIADQVLMLENGRIADLETFKSLFGQAVDLLDPGLTASN